MRFAVALPTLVLLAAATLPAAALSSPAPESPAASAAPAKESFKAVVTAETAVILAGSSKAYYPVGHMPAGSILEVVDASYPGYCEIVPPGCCAAFVAKAKAQTDDKGAIATVTEDGAECFAAGLELTPQKSFRVQRKLAKGETLEILAVVGDFYRVEEPKNTTVFVPAAEIRRATQADLKDGPPEAKPGFKPAEGGAKKDVAKATPKEHKPETKKPETKPASTPEKVAVKTPEKAPEKPAEAAPADNTDTPATDPALRAAEGRRDAAYKAAKDAAVPSATLKVLLAEYADLAKRTDFNTIDAQLAGGRVAQLTRDLQISENIEKVAAAEKAAIEAGKPGDAVPQVGYDAVGQLKISTVYSGNALPKLYRLADPATDNTIAYVLPDAVDGALLNKLVGVQGEIEVDPTLKLRVIRVKKAEALTADGKPAK